MARSMRAFGTDSRTAWQPDGQTNWRSWLHRTHCPASSRAGPISFNMKNKQKMLFGGVIGQKNLGALALIMHNQLGRTLCDTMTKLCRLFHTIIICNYHNMQYQVTTMYLTGENRVCPKAARACPNPRRLHILRTGFFQDLKFSGMIPRIIFYHFWSFGRIP